jgi:hypothetical protein
LPLAPEVASAGRRRLQDRLLGLADVEEDGKIVFKKVDPDDGGKKKKKELVQS